MGASVLRAFLAGFLATLAFHQGALGLLHAAGLLPVAPFSLAPTWPLGVPKVISLAFWGGVWAIVLWRLLRARVGASYWLGWLVLGAVGPTAVALLIVFPLKGVAVSLDMLPVGLLLNGVWGVGSALLLAALARAPHFSKSP